jgi:hypothetical protein
MLSDSRCATGGSKMEVVLASNCRLYLSEMLRRLNESRHVEKNKSSRENQEVLSNRYAK